MFNLLNDEIKTFLFKIIIPALVAVSVKIAIASQKAKISLFNVLGSFVIGVGVAYLSGHFVLSTVSPDMVSLVVAIIALSGEKIAYFLMYTFTIDQMALSILEYLSGLIRK